MTPNDPVMTAAAWVLLLAALYHASGILRFRAGELQRMGLPYPISRRIRDLLIPTGFGALGLRGVLKGYGFLSESGWGNRFLFAVALVGIVGGIAASRIRRMG